MKPANKFQGKGDMMTYWVTSKDLGDRSSRMSKPTMTRKSSNILTAILQGGAR